MSVKAVFQSIKVRWLSIICPTHPATPPTIEAPEAHVPIEAATPTPSKAAGKAKTNPTPTIAPSPPNMPLQRPLS